MRRFHFSIGGGEQPEQRLRLSIEFHAREFPLNLCIALGLSILSLELLPITFTQAVFAGLYAAIMSSLRYLRVS